MPRFFFDVTDLIENTIVIRGDDHKHLIGALRARTGDYVTMCDGQGMDYETKIIQIDDKQTVLSVDSSFASVSEPEIKITLFQGLSKGERMEYAFQKATELGVHTCIPLLSSRCIAKPNDNKLRRLSTIVREAAMQSSRGRIPEVMNPVSFRDMLSMFSVFDLVLIPYENEEKLNLKKALKMHPGIRSIAVIIGPEGGFSPDEVQSVVDAGGLSVTLGPRILRTETAPVAVISNIIYEFEKGE